MELNKTNEFVYVSTFRTRIDPNGIQGKREAKEEGVVRKVSVGIFLRIVSQYFIQDGKFLEGEVDTVGKIKDVWAKLLADDAYLQRRFVKFFPKDIDHNQHVIKLKKIREELQSLSWGFSEFWFGFDDVAWDFYEDISENNIEVAPAENKPDAVAEFKKAVSKAKTKTTLKQ
jgi:hypothetical protein